MIQRIQSVFLLCVAILMITVLFLPIWDKHNSFFTNGGVGTVRVGEDASLTAWTLTYARDQKINTSPTYYIAILAILTAAVAVYNIFNYKNRRFQMIIGAVNSFLIAGTAIAMLVTSNNANTLFSPSVQGQLESGFYVGFGAFLFNILANRFIQRDERLVKSADRLR